MTSNGLISREKLWSQTVEWETAAVKHVKKIDPVKDREEWFKWSAILQERRAFRHDVETAPAEHPELSEWCTDCKEYDQEKHCCPRYNRVIREALTEAQKTGYWKRVPGYVTPGGDPVWCCSECGKGVHVYGIEHGTYGADISDGQWKACPNCGIRMEGEQDD